MRLEHAAESDPLAAQVEHFLREHPGCTNAQVAQALGKRPSLVHYSVERLAEAGEACKEREGRDVRLFPVEAAG